MEYESQPDFNDTKQSKTDILDQFLGTSSDEDD